MVVDVMGGDVVTEMTEDEDETHDVAAADDV